RAQAHLPAGRPRPDRRRAGRLPARRARVRRAGPGRRWPQAAHRPPGRPGAAAPRTARRGQPVRRGAGRGLCRPAAADHPPSHRRAPADHRRAPDRRRGTRPGRRGPLRPTRVPQRQSRRAAVSSWDLWWWIILPYAAMVTFVIGHIWRWRYDQFGWTSRSTQLQERRLLKWGSPLFHYATFGAIAGHVLGILIPQRWTAAIGIPESAYRWFSAAAGTAAAVGIIAGVAILAGRRLFVPRVRATTSPVDWLALIL